MALAARRAIRKAVFLDDGGTLIESPSRRIDFKKVRLLPKAESFLKELHARGFALVIVSHQPGVAFGSFQLDDVLRLKKQLSQLFEQIGAPLTGYYYCPHHPAGSVPGFSISCDCRKPEAGLIRRAAREHAIDLDRSWMVGDLLDDVQAGHRAGCRSILVEHGNEVEWDLSRDRLPELMAADLIEAAREIAGDAGTLVESALRRGTGE